MRQGVPPEHVPTSAPRLPQLSYRNKTAMSFDTSVEKGEFVLVPSLKGVSP